MYSPRHALSLSLPLSCSLSVVLHHSNVSDDEANSIGSQRNEAPLPMSETDSSNARQRLELQKIAVINAGARNLDFTNLPERSFRMMLDALRLRCFLLVS